MQTEYPFTLPKGYVDSNKELHRNGIMRLATARDEIEAMNHPKVRTMPEYGTIVLLSKVITQLEGVENLSVEVVEALYSADVNFLQNLYETINHDVEATIHVVCPHCGKEFEEPLNFTQGE